MRQGNWTAQYTVLAQSAATNMWTNMPTSETFLFGSTRHIVAADANGMTYVRLRVNRQATAANTGSKLILRYSPTFSATLASYVDIGVSEVSVLVDSPNTYVSSEWIEIRGDCRIYDEIYLAVIGISGNGSGNADPEFGNISVSFC